MKLLVMLLGAVLLNFCWYCANLKDCCNTNHSNDSILEMLLNYSEYGKEHQACATSFQLIMRRGLVPQRSAVSNGEGTKVCRKPSRKLMSSLKLNNKNKESIM